MQDLATRVGGYDPIDAAALELTILIPCLNEAETIATCVRKAMAYLARAGIAGEVLVSDNGSTDGSVALAKLHGARVVHAPVAGYGGALRCGIVAARDAVPPPLSRQPGALGGRPAVLLHSDRRLPLRDAGLAANA